MSVSTGPVFLSTLPSIERPTAPEYLEVGLLKVDQAQDKREATGLALPYNEDLDRPDYLTGARRQRFAPGAAKVRPDAKLYYGHDHISGGLPIGRWVEATDTEAGVLARVRFAKTPKADEVLELARPDDDGTAVLDRFSIGYWPVRSHLEEEGAVLVHDEVDVFEVSIVPDPAYKSAVVDSVLTAHPARPAPTKETPMTPEQRARLAALRAMTTLSAAEAGELSTLSALEAANPTPPAPAVPEGLASAADVAGLSTAVEDLGRQIATLGAGGGPTPPAGPVVPGSSYGEFLQMVAAGDKAAMDFLAYVGGTVADLGDVVKDTWVGERFKFIEAQRTLLNFFSRSPLPASGMGVEYGIEGTDTTQVGEQAAEGDTLAYGKITFDTDTAKLKTYGGWGEMSFQQIQRSPVNVVERYFASLLRRYAQTTELAVNARTLAAGTALSGTALDMTKADGWTRFVIRAARVLKNRGYPVEAILVGFDVFEELALMRDGANGDGPRLLNRDTGRINVVGLSGDVFNLPVIPFETGNTTGVIRAANSEAIRTYEAAGAPFRLQDDDITKLTHAASVYGYMADATEVPGAVVKPA